MPVLKVRNKPIVLGSDECPPINEGFTYGEIDGDMIHDGDMLMCPLHPSEPIYVFGTNWWKNEGGPMGEYGWVTFELETDICFLCKNIARYKVICGSYGG